MLTDWLGFVAHPNGTGPSSVLLVTPVPCSWRLLRQCVNVCVEGWAEKFHRALLTEQCSPLPRRLCHHCMNVWVNVWMWLRALWVAGRLQKLYKKAGLSGIPAVASQNVCWEKLLPPCEHWNITFRCECVLWMMNAGHKFWNPTTKSPQ